MASSPLPVPPGTPGAAAVSSDWFVSISGQLRFLSTGERAILRRLELGRSAVSDGTIIKLLMRAKVAPDLFESDYERWRLVVHVAAMLAGTGAIASHDEKRRLGAALHDAGVSENRILRLLAARGAGLHDQIRLMARLLARPRKPVNLWTVYHLLAGDDGKAQSARIRIAQDYYAAAARS
ncbi:type I-E CRISPR-associated protein Cse2/CasB [Sphingomonas adhaesiva]|uniref:type I-E CRISPR-associated protein Cse2/CasB n=1 Tax=Sphingomonas adhaesiva TaxID=28212 RepID=UPI002FF89C05